MKLFICALNGWNPYAEEIQKLPYFYWLVAIRAHRYKEYRDWKENLEPQAELIASIIAPENFEEYREFIEQKEHNKKEGLADQVKVGDTTIAKSNAYYDPRKGLVKEDTGEILIPKDEFKNRINIEDGIAISI
jgi:hypothetical protein